MFRLLTFLGKLIIPILIVVLSILTMIPMVNVHNEQLSKDNFFTKLTDAVRVDPFVLKDETLALAEYNYNPSNDKTYRNEVIKDPNKKQYRILTFTTAIDKDGNKLKYALTKHFSDKMTEIANYIQTGNTDKVTSNELKSVVKVSNLLYKLRIPLGIAILAFILILLILALFRWDKSFRVLHKFFKSLSFRTLVLSLVSFVVVTGLGFVGPGARKAFGDFMGFDYFNIEVLDILNMAWVKYVGWLIVPALLACAVLAILSAFFGFLSLFQKEKKEARNISDKLESKSDKKNKSKSTTDASDSNQNNNPQSNINTESSAVLLDPINQTSQSSKDSVNPQGTNYNNFRPVSNTPFPVEETKPREDLDPFLERLSKSLGDNPQENSGTKIILPNDKR
ncbi:MAG: hypothetical protein ACRCXZ_07780 [Patescibacteria group bacterium]